MGYKKYLDGSGHRGLADYTCKPTQRAGEIYSPPVAQRAGGHAGVQEGEHDYYNDFAWDLGRICTRVQRPCVRCKLVARLPRERDREREREREK